MFLQIPSWEGSYVHWLTSALANPHTEQAFLVRSLTCPDRVLRFSATTNHNGKAVRPHKTILCWLILIMSYLVVTTGLTTRDSLRNTICHSIFGCVSIHFLLVLPWIMVHSYQHFLSVLLQASMLGLTSFGSLVFFNI